MKRLVILLLTFSCILSAREIPIKLEFAKTESERSFGLMRRTYLPENQGMLFINPNKAFSEIWMFNCFIDLAVAFLDEDGIIREIHELRAYPDKMKEIPPDMQFFVEKGVKSSFPASFVLEMNKGWFYNHHVFPGDKLTWDEKTGDALIINVVK